jgi:hypothetical protein
MVPFKTTSLNVNADAIIGTTLSAGNIIYAQGGNSTLWNSAYTIVQVNSADWYNATASVSSYQTLSINESAYELSISDGNTVSLAFLSSVPGTGQTMIGATSSNDGQEGLVPKPLSGDNTKYLRGDGTWQNVSVASTVQYLQTSPTINLDIQEYDTFVIVVTGSITFTYSNFPLGKSVNVYLSANHNSYIPHTFPENTKFSELGDDNIIYSFNNYTTRILLQNLGPVVINFSSITKNMPDELPPPYYYGNGVLGVGLDLIDFYLENL